MSEAAARDAEATTTSRTTGAAMSINELVLVGTGFVLARVVYVFYFSQRKTVEADRS
jgi:hypothetical protein